jgi:peptide chain release factor subunit 1
MTETFVIDVHTMTPATLAARVAALEEEFERGEEVAEVETAYREAAAGDLAVVGLERVLRAVNRHAVARLLVNDAAHCEGAICANCGALSLPAESCLECGGQVEEVPELLEALARSVVDAGGSVEHVIAPTRLSHDVVAATLRFVPW